MQQPDLGWNRGNITPPDITTYAKIPGQSQERPKLHIKTYTDVTLGNDPISACNPPGHAPCTLTSDRSVSRVKLDGDRQRYLLNAACAAMEEPSTDYRKGASSRCLRCDLREEGNSEA